MCGVVCVTVYAQFFSLCAGVGLLANGILCAACAVIAWVDRKALLGTIRRLASAGEKTVSTGEMGGSILPGNRERSGRQTTLRLCVILALFLFFAYGASRGMIHYDTGLYHAQSIRWIEEYGVVKGLGNLHCRLAYNSSSFALSALYSMAFLGGQSYHCAAGWLAFLLAAVCLPVGKSLRTGRLRTSGFARVMCVYYLVNIFDEMISPASDYFMVLVAFYIVIKWLDLVESGEKTVLPYALLCVLGVFLMTVKLSAALILLLTIYPACRLLREKRWKETGVYLGLGLLTAIPFFVRNVLISGWLVYPFTQIDLFHVVWKIPKGLADYDAREIQVWGRGYTDVTQFDMPIREWLPGWLRTLAGSDKLLVAAAAAAVVLFFLEAAYLAWRWGKERRAPGHLVSLHGQGTAAGDGSAARDSVTFPAFLTVQATVAASFLFWLCTSPLIRYGCVWVYLTAAVVLGGIYDRVMHSGAAGERMKADARVRDERVSGTKGGRAAGDLRWRPAAGWTVSAAVILLLAYKGFALARETAGSYVNDYWLVQKDYENYETYAYRIEGAAFYCPVEGDRVGYGAFPSSPSEAQIAFLGEEIAEGFRAAE
ncbi:MAG: hypothetical protein K2M20_05750 [Lachnospiraceae bacterium]|nr:hypothetical protein [Lachnospiraceae bacterium]